MPDVPENMIRDPKALRALSHPLRWKLINLLTSGGPATATQCAQATGESVASCSYHLNMLAKYGFVAEARGGQGREKPWRLTRVDQSYTATGLDEVGASAAHAATEALLDNEFAETKARFRRRDEMPDDWREQFGVNSVTTVLTLEEMTALNAELSATVHRFADRIDHPEKRPVNGETVRLFFVTSRIPQD